MSFVNPWVLPLALAPLVWIAWEWTRSVHKTGLVLKALSLVAIILAFAEPRLSVWETKLAVAVLADVSASVSDEDLGTVSHLTTEIERSRGRHTIRVIPFARSTRPPEASERADGWVFRHTSGEAGRGTDLETAVMDAIASLPSGQVPRVVLISDGVENRGSIARAAWQARQLGVPVDTYALPGRPEPRLMVESVSLPVKAFAGEQFPLDLVVRSPEPSDGQVEIFAEGQSLGSSSVTLREGVNTLRVHASVDSEGAVDISGLIRAGALGEARFAQAVTLQKPRLLYLSQDPPSTGGHLLRALQLAGFEIQERSILSTETDPLEDYQLLVLNNWDLEAVAAVDKENIEEYVRQGGGLLVIGGENNVYVAETAEVEDPLDRALPAALVPPESPEGTCVVLVVDKSASMDGAKIQLARLAAIGVIENLRPVDRIGVLVFDNSHRWAVPIRNVDDRDLLERLVSGIMPDGGTQIARALTEGYQRILPVNASYKHIVLLTDGISEEGNAMEIAQAAAQNEVTISTVGLGQDVNNEFLEEVAKIALGKSYLLSDPSGLAQILLRDVMEHTGTTTVENETLPVVLREREVLDGVDMESAPPLQGFVRYEAKPTADTILGLEDEDQDPLLVAWQHGLGRSAVFASDAKSRWASAWVDWPGFDRFWSNVARDLLPRSAPSTAVVRYDSTRGELVADYRLSEQVPEPDPVPDIFVIGPNDFRRALEIRKTAPGTYQGRTPIGDVQGLFRIRPLEESLAFPEVGFYRQEEEMTEFGSDEELLRRVADFTGGRFEPAPSDVFDSGGRGVPSSMDLWPGLLALAVFLTLGEIVHRKWPGIRASFART